MGYRAGETSAPRKLMSIRRVEAFREAQRPRFPAEKREQVSIVFNEIIRYLFFLQVVLRRYSKANESYIEGSDLFRTKSNEYATRRASASDQRRFKKILQAQMKRTRILHLDIETFYLFSRILLDKVAQALVVYFGEGNYQSLSHRDLIKQFIEIRGGERFIGSSAGLAIYHEEFPREPY
jgi:hypothetical protein